jgi:hypothetical protein
MNILLTKNRNQKSKEKSKDGNKTFRYKKIFILILIVAIAAVIIILRKLIGVEICGDCNKITKLTEFSGIITEPPYHCVGGKLYSRLSCLIKVDNIEVEVNDTIFKIGQKVSVRGNYITNSLVTTGCKSCFIK